MADMSNVVQFRSRLPDPRDALAVALREGRAHRGIIAAEIERLIAVLDAWDGDPDLEDDDPAEDDDPLEVVWLEDVQAVMEPPRDWARAWNASIRGEDMEDSHDREMQDHH